MPRTLRLTSGRPDDHPAAPSLFLSPMPHARLLALGLCLLAGGALVGCSRPGPEPARPPAQGPDRTVLDNVRATPRLSALAEALDASGLAEALTAAGPFTLFAPTDAAFAAVPDSLWRTPGPSQRRNTLAFHLVPNRVPPPAFDGRTVRTLHGGALHLDRDGGTLTVDRAPVLDTLLASNGVVYVIGAVLRPPGAQE